MNNYRNPLAQWLGSPNFSLDRDGHNLDSDPRWIVMHTMVGTWQSANGRFQQSAQQASAHYGVCLDGSLKQWVDEKDASWAAGNYAVNLDGINIEHEDGGDYNGPRTPALYQASARLVAEICRHYGIPCDRAHIRLHKEVSDAPTGCPDSLDVDGIVHTAQGLLGSTTGIAGSEVIVPQEEPMTLSEKWAHIRTQFLIAEPDIAPDNNLIGSWAAKIADDGNNVDAVIQALWGTLPQFAAYRNRITALLTAGPAPAGPMGPPGPPGPAGVAAPHKHTVTGIAEINT